MVGQVVSQALGKKCMSVDVTAPWEGSQWGGEFAVGDLGEGDLAWSSGFRVVFGGSGLAAA